MRKPNHDVERLLQDYRSTRVFRNLQAERLRGSQRGIVLHGCADGHQCPEILSHLKGLVDCPHYFGGNGGALWLDPEFTDPLFSADELRVVRRLKVYETCEAMVLKNTNRAGVLIHEPCGKVALRGMDVDSALDALIRAQRWLKVAIHEMRVHLQGRLATYPWATHIPMDVKVAALIQIAKRDGTASTLWVDDHHHRFESVPIIGSSGLRLAA